MFLVLIMVLSQQYSPEFGPQEVSVELINTWEIDYASDIQDITPAPYPDFLAIRSNGDSRIYLADQFCNYVGEVVLPDSIEGFGLSCDNDLYFLNTYSGELYITDGSDSWSMITEPSPSSGLDRAWWLSSNHIFEVEPFFPHRLRSYDLWTPEWEYYALEDTEPSDEMTGLTAGMMATMHNNEPCALIVTTRYGNDLLFYMMDGSPSYELIERQNCPLDVEESLGLTWVDEVQDIYWSYKGIDGKFYISLLSIEFFYAGGVGDELNQFSNCSPLSIESNPAYGTPVLSVELPFCCHAELTVYDISGRVLEELFQGYMNTGENLFSISVPAGVYLAELSYGNTVESIKFTVIN